MIWLRSLAFAVLFHLATAVLAIVGVPVMAAGPRAILAHAALWGRVTMWLLRICCGIRYEVRGTVPRGPVIVASKHQSAWDTLILPVLLDAPAFVLKRELLYLPLIGLYMKLARHIALDRAAGPRALRRMVHEARELAAAGRPIVIYPEGTRVAPGERGRYLPGVLALVAEVGMPVVPVALNSGYYWGRRSFLKRPGCIVIEFLEPLPADLGRREILRVLEDRIEAVCEKLGEEARRDGA